MIRYIAKSKKTSKSLLPGNYATPANLIKAVKAAGYGLQDLTIQTFQEMELEGADGRNTSRGKQFSSRKNKNHTR
jgi:hypothetical protein|tara:strand:+ start:4037 stop:4261 length:225 start_codon:yes stop_codon:yes gene_type:complete